MNEIKILAVDNEQNFLDMIIDTLHAYDVTPVTSPLEAIERIKSKRYNIIITDYQMPIINGIEFLEEVKEEYKDIAFVSIFCTAYGTTHLFKNEYRQNLFNIFLEKPFSGIRLLKVITEAIIILNKIKFNRK